MAQDDAGGESGGNAAGGSSDGGGHGNLSSDVSSVAGDHEGGAAVETIPSEPEDEHSEGLESVVARVEGLGRASHGVEASLAGSDNDSSHQSGESSDHVHDARSCEVDHSVGRVVPAEQRAGVALGVWESTPGREEARAPAPVDNHGVDDGGQDDGVDEVSLDPGTLGDGTGNDGGASSSESPLEEPSLPSVRSSSSAIVVHLVEEEVVLGSDEASGVLSVGDEVSDRPEAKSGERGIHHVLEQDVRHVLGVDETGGEHGEAALHEEHQRSADHQPGDVHVPGVVARGIVGLLDSGSEGGEVVVCHVAGGHRGLPHLEVGHVSHLD
mmetsp:Transcript_6486/g.10270  ORF Transcript_6486/g.10270 Transcript_6486/m.10270 type:complete len:326 (+) Transcript_6486:999-1976(+)